jgi:hypothetical protein
MDRQPFFDFRRFNIGMTHGDISQIAGLFHVTAEEAFPSIMNDGLKAGIDLTTTGRGRVDIHMLIAPPYPNDVVGNGRVKKMWNKGYQAVVILSIKLEALDLTDARINHQGLVLQRTCVHPNMIDYALKITQAPDGQTRCAWLFASDVRGDVEVVRNSGAFYGEWCQTFLDNLRKCGDTDPDPITAAERWARANKFRHTPIQLTNSSRGKLRSSVVHAALRATFEVLPYALDVPRNLLCRSAQ